MVNMNRFVQVVIVGFVFAIDHSQGDGLIGFVLAAYYLLSAVYSFIRRDRPGFKKRLVLFAVFAVEMFAVASLTETPLDTGFLQRWVDRLAGHEYYKTK